MDQISYHQSSTWLPCNCRSLPFLMAMDFAKIGEMPSFYEFPHCKVTLRTNPFSKVENQISLAHETGFWLDYG